MLNKFKHIWLTYILSNGTFENQKLLFPWPIMTFIKDVNKLGQKGFLDKCFNHPLRGYLRLVLSFQFWLIECFISANFVLSFWSLTFLLLNKKSELFPPWFPLSALTWFHWFVSLWPSNCKQLSCWSLHDKLKEFKTTFVIKWMNLFSVYLFILVFYIAGVDASRWPLHSQWKGSPYSFRSVIWIIEGYCGITERPLSVKC